MPTFKLEENTSSGYAVLPVDAVVTVQCEAINVRHVEGKDGKEGWDKLEFTFNIVGVPTALESEYGSLVGSKIWGSVPARFTEHPDNKLRQWSEALLNIGNLEVGFELDTELLVGRQARAIIGQYKKRTGDSQHQVAGLLPAAGGGFAQQAPAVAPAVQQAAASWGITPPAADPFAGWDNGSDVPPF